MQLSDKFEELENLRKLMGARLSDWEMNHPTLPTKQPQDGDLEKKGVEINLEEVEVVAGQLLAYKGKQVVLYIKDTGSSYWTLENNPEDSRKFHISECQTLSTMRSSGRFERYVVTNRTDGLFLVDWRNEDGKRGEMEAALKVCKYCLRNINWRDYATGQSDLSTRSSRMRFRESIRNEFSISDFLMSYSTFFRTTPSRRDVTAQLNEYVTDWNEISERKRRQQNWKCEACSVDLSEMRGSLHCHHISGVVTDNSDENLMVLCAICHSEQPFHDHMRVPERAKRLINRRRIEQGLMPS